MASCNLCPPGEREIPDEEMAGHLRAAHPEVEADDSTIVDEASLGPAEDGEWRAS